MNNSEKCFISPCNLCKLNKIMKFLGRKGPTQTGCLDLVILKQEILFYQFVNILVEK